MVAIAVLGSACVTGGSGCSILFAKGPPERVEPHQPIRCTSSYTAPVVDGLITALQIVRTLYAISLKDSDYKNPEFPRAADIGIGAGLSGLFLVSTGIGISRVGDCNELLEKIERRPEPRRPRPPPSLSPPQPMPRVDPDADTERAASSAAQEGKAAGEAAGASQREPAATPAK